MTIRVWHLSIAVMAAAFVSHVIGREWMAAVWCANSILLLYTLCTRRKGAR